MREMSPSNSEEEPSAEHAAISMADILQQLGPLQAKLAEYRSDAASLGPDGVTQSARLQQDILELLIDAATQNSACTTIYMHEVALAVQERTGLNVVRAATIPFIRRPDVPGYQPDFVRLAAETGPDDLAFSAAYMTVRSYCDGTFPLEPEADR
jgi:hypothetical protein